MPVDAREASENEGGPLAATWAAMRAARRVLLAVGYTGTASDLRDAVDALKAALAASEAALAEARAGGWRDMAAAPRDGTRVLLAYREAGAIAVSTVEWDDQPDDDEWPEGSWDQGNIEVPEGAALGWQPLPPPPDLSKDRPPLDTSGRRGDGADATGEGLGIGVRVRKTKGSSWQGRVVGTYSTALTPDGYCVESEREPGSVQLYPAAALERVPDATGGEAGR